MHRLYHVLTLPPLTSHWPFSNTILPLNQPLFRQVFGKFKMWSPFSQLRPLNLLERASVILFSSIDAKDFSKAINLYMCTSQSASRINCWPATNDAIHNQYHHSNYQCHYHRWSAILYCAITLGLVFCYNPTFATLLHLKIENHSSVRA